jgi:Predicted phosphohydrolases
MLFIKKPYLQEPKVDSMTIMWQTDIISTSKVYVWEAYAPNIPANVYYSLYTPIGEAREFEGSIEKHHKVILFGLDAEKDYCYQVESMENEETLLSEINVFRTAPVKGKAFKFAFTAETGGSGQREYIAPLADQIDQAHPDILIALGDLVWDGDNAAEWDDLFFHPYQKLLSSTPLYHCPGNHENHTELMNQLFSFPRYYSFEYADVHFISLDSTLFAQRTYHEDNSSEMKAFDTFNEDDIQWKFLKKELENSKAIWKVVYFHYPPYSSAIFETIAMRRLCPLLEKYKVDFVFSSHTIHYERSHPLINGEINPAGIRYIVVGGSGTYADWLRHKTNSVTAKIIAKPHFVQVNVTPYSFEIQAIDSNGMLFDSCEIKK